MQFSIKQDDLAGAVARLKPYVAKGAMHSTNAEVGVLFEAQDGHVVMTGANSIGYTVTLPAQIHKAGKVVLGLAGLEYLTKSQFASEEIIFKAKNKTLAPPYQGGQAIRGAECVAEVGGSRFHQEAVHAGMFTHNKHLVAKAYRLVFTIDPQALAAALKRVSGYVPSVSYQSHYVCVESVKRNQLTIVGSNGRAMAVETVGCSTKGEVPRLAIPLSIARGIITALERFKPPAPRVSLGRSEPREVRVSFEVDTGKGERWRVSYGDDVLVFTDSRIIWPEYQSRIATKGRRLLLPGKALVKALAALPSDASEIVTLTQPRNKAAVFEWVRHENKNRLAIEIPGMPLVRAMDVNRKLLASVLKSFRGDQVLMLMPREATNPYRLTCPEDPALTVALAPVVRVAPRVAPPPSEPVVVDEDDDENVPIEHAIDPDDE